MTANAEIKKSIDRKQWTRESFFSDLERKKDAKIVSLVEELLAWIRPKVTDFWYGKGKTMGSIVPFIYKNKRHQLFAFWSNGSIELYFQYYKEKLPFSDLGKREEL
ncbi:MAG: hypothetical protein GY757_00285, partial [bacterium]|nr:hypothetical protein [bacterium]